MNEDERCELEVDDDAARGALAWYVKVEDVMTARTALRRDFPMNGDFRPSLYA